MQLNKMNSYMEFNNLEDEYANKIVNDQINVSTVKKHLVEYGNKMILYEKKAISSTGKESFEEANVNADFEPSTSIRIIKNTVRITKKRQKSRTDSWITYSGGKRHEAKRRSPQSIF